MQPAFIVAAAACYPGAPVGNDAMDQYIAPLDVRCARIKRRILAENGIRQRHYAIDVEGRTTVSVAGLGAQALATALGQLPPSQRALDLLAAASTGPDVSVPGLANMVQGEARLPPLKAVSLAGVCASSVAALDYAVAQIATGQSRQAAVVASEIPSRLFKKSRLSRTRDLQFDAHFLRWMLSDGAGCWILADAPAAQGLSLRVDFVHLRSFSGDYPTCMQVGQGGGNDGPGYLDYPSLAEAEEAGAYLLRQDIRLLPNLFDVAIHEYAQLVQRGRVDPGRIDHFLAHYSSERFKGVVDTLMQRAGLRIDASRWYSNLTQRGNMGAASIVTMLADFLQERRDALVPGQQLLLFVPESGRFSVGFIGLTVVGPDAGSAPVPSGNAAQASPLAVPVMDEPPTVHADPAVADVLRQLLAVWHGYRSEVLRTRIARQVFSASLSTQDYATWMAGWIGQVRQGAVWMRTAASRLPQALDPLRALIELHAGEEQNDWRVLFADYRAAGGTVEDPDALRRNPGAEALNAYMQRVADSRQAAGLLGATYIIEGTGNRIVPTLLPHVRASLGQASHATRFLAYHGEADVAHMQRWLAAVELLLAHDPAAGELLVETARDVAGLYVLAWKHALTGQD